MAKEITEPGLYPDLPADDYHAQRLSLSSSGARRLLAPSCPALFRHEQDAPREPRKVWDIGTAAHRIVFGDGPEVVLIDRPRWDTKEVKAEVAEIRSAGNVPLHRAEYDQVHAMAEQLRRDETAAALFNPLAGRPEQSLFWRDAQTGTLLRGRLDWLPHPTSGRMILGDYKTAVAVDPESIERAIYEYGLHQQAPWYMAGVRELGLAADVAFLFIFQMKTPPYLVTPVELTLTALTIGQQRNRAAITTFAHCTRTGRWPGYADPIAQLSIPPWAEARHRLEYA